MGSPFNLVPIYSRYFLERKKISPECSLPLPDDMNVFICYYIDWWVQLLSGLEFYLMYATIALFFIGMCFYLTGMADDLRTILHDLNGNAQTITNGIINEIKFHCEIFE